MNKFLIWSYNFLIKWKQFSCPHKNSKIISKTFKSGIVTTNQIIHIRYTRKCIICKKTWNTNAIEAKEEMSSV